METIPTRLPDDTAVARPTAQTRHPAFVPPLRGLGDQRVVIGSREIGLAVAPPRKMDGRSIEARPPIAVVEMRR